MRHALIALSLLTLLPGAGALRAQDAPPMTMDHGDMDGGAKTPADKAFAQAMDKMMKSMGAKPSGNADHDFVVMMIPHHQGAIDMAKVELQYGKDPMLRELAADIVKAQDKEIAMMKAWLAKHGK